MYVELCEHLGVHFSRRYFREHFLEAAVELLQDPVPNVRMRACPLLPRMKRMIRLPEDALLLERMSKLCTALTTDSDRDVSAVARDVVAQFKVRSTGARGRCGCQNAVGFEILGFGL